MPSLSLAVVTCMDVRIDPLRVLGLSLGQAHILRNAGARVTDDVVRSLVISQRALSTDAVVLMPHTHCGVLGLDGAAIRRKAEADRGDKLPPIDFRAMDNLDEALRQDAALLRHHPWMPSTLAVVGLVLDIESLDVTPLDA